MVMTIMPVSSLSLAYADSGRSGGDGHESNRGQAVTSNVSNTNLSFSSEDNSGSSEHSGLKLRNKTTTPTVHRDDGHESEDGVENESEIEDDDHVVVPPVNNPSPIISGITVTNIGSTTATINWNTDLLSNSTILYGTTTPLTFLNGITSSSAGLVTSHSVNLTNLIPNTLYDFLVTSKTAGNQTSTSTTLSFTTAASTPPPVVTPAPNIVFVGTFNISSTSAAVIWVTDQATNSNLWLSTTTPVSILGTPIATSSTLTYFHMVNLSSLSPATNYFYAVKSANSTSQIASSTTQSFTTPTI